jgi:hypothetical protein
MRYKQGKVDPKGFKMFFKSKGIPLKEIPRYFGNRLHILFHLAGVFYRLQPLLLEYLQKYCSQTAGLKSALLKDLKNVLIMQDIQLLGLLGRLITGPWMARFYTDESGVTNLSMNNDLKKCMTSLDSYIKDPSLLITSGVDVFGQALPVGDATLEYLRESIFDDRLRNIARTVIEGFTEVLKRQLERYLTGDLSQVTDQLVLATKAAPLHNMQAERVMAMTDSQARRAPNASYAFIESKVKSKVNHTLHWLDTLDKEQQSNAVQFAIKKLDVCPRKRQVE